MNRTLEQAITTVNQEGSILNWLTKHLIEICLAALIALMVWEAKLLISMDKRIMLLEVTASHVNKAVNNVGKSEKTLRQLVEDIETDVGILKDRSSRSK